MTGKVKPSVYIVGHNMAITKMFYNKYFPIETSLPKADIVCFIGGADINPEIYGHKEGPHSIHMHPPSDVRDEYSYGQSECLGINQMKVGICRGAQYLNAKNGGTLYQHVNNHTNDHDVIDTLFKEKECRVSVTSTHHQMMNPSPDAEILAYSEGIANEYWDQDGRLLTKDYPIIEPEVVWYEDTKSLCFQPHPEYMTVKPTSGVHSQCTEYFFDLINFLR